MEKNCIISIKAANHRVYTFDGENWTRRTVILRMDHTATMAMLELAESRLGVLDSPGIDIACSLATEYHEHKRVEFLG